MGDRRDETAPRGAQRTEACKHRSQHVARGKHASRCAGSPGSDPTHRGPGMGGKGEGGVCAIRLRTLRSTPDPLSERERHGEDGLSVHSCTRHCMWPVKPCGHRSIPCSGRSHRRIPPGEPQTRSCCTHAEWPSSCLLMQIPPISSLRLSPPSSRSRRRGERAAIAPNSQLCFTANTRVWAGGAGAERPAEGRGQKAVEQRGPDCGVQVRRHLSCSKRQRPMEACVASRASSGLRCPRDRHFLAPSCKRALSPFSA